MSKEYYTVIRPVTNLRKAPGEDVFSGGRDDLLLSQLLFGEKVLLRDEESGWALVEAIEQQTFRTNGRWEGYYGWVRKESIHPRDEDADDIHGIVKTVSAPVLAGPSEDSATLFELSVGTIVPVLEVSARDQRYCAIKQGEGIVGWIERARLRIADREPPEDRDRENILATALLFLGVPYLWGGRSMHMPGLATIATGVDCSGLVNLVYRAHGIHVPRDAHEQWMKATPVPAGELGPGDPIFVARGESVVSHVVLFAGGENFIEAHETGAHVRTSVFGERFGIDLARLPGERDRIRLEDDRVVSFGRFLP